MKAAKPKKRIASPPLNTAQISEPTHDEIARHAYSLWEQQGRPPHQEVAIWLQAENELRPAKNQPGAEAQGCLAAPR